MRELGRQKRVANSWPFEMEIFPAILTGNFGWVDAVWEKIRYLDPESLSDWVQCGDGRRCFAPLKLWKKTRRAAAFLGNFFESQSALGTELFDCFSYYVDCCRHEYFIAYSNFCVNTYFYLVTANLSPVLATSVIHPDYWKIINVRAPP